MTNSAFVIHNKSNAIKKKKKTFEIHPGPRAILLHVNKVLNLEPLNPSVCNFLTVLA